MFNVIKRETQKPSVPVAAHAVDTHSLNILIQAVQDLSHAHDLNAIMEIVRKAARNLLGADGATFVLRDEDRCFYADEDAISPLWKGSRFPMSACISGWVMNHGEPVVIEDIYQDARIPADAYRPTFVKSLAMVPIRKESPIGAIGNYWASNRVVTPEEIELLQALANSTSVAIQNAALYTQLQGRLHALQESNKELSRFAWAVSHDLREPLRTITTNMEMLREDHGDKLDDSAQNFMHTAIKSASMLDMLIRRIFDHARMQTMGEYSVVDLNLLVQNALSQLTAQRTEANASLRISHLPLVFGDVGMLGIAIQHLLDNALKFRALGRDSEIEINAERKEGFWEIRIADNGIGIGEEYWDKIFEMFFRLYPKEQYGGAGMGLSTARKIIQMHGGKIWCESMAGVGSVFFFTLPVWNEK